MPRARGKWPTGTLLAKLGHHARDDLLSLAPERRFAPGTPLLHQGDRSTHVFVLKADKPSAAACVKVTARLSDGAECLLGIRVSGDVVGELAPIRGSARSATVTTCSAVRAHRIDERPFMDFLDRYREAWSAITGVIADQLDWANERRMDFTAYSVPIRLARALIALADRHGYSTGTGIDIGVQLSQEEIAMLIGAGRDAVGKATRQLKAAGLIDTAYRGLVVTDWPGLCRYAGPRE